MSKKSESQQNKWRKTLYSYLKQIFQINKLYGRAIKTGPILEKATLFPGHSELTPLTAALQKQTRALLKEIDALPRMHELSSTQGRFAHRDGRRWSVLPLRLYGLDLNSNQLQVPALTPFLQNHPEVTSAAISILESGKRIRPHRGPYRGIMRYHLTLHCDESDASRNCQLRVANQWIPYREGEDLLWDDTFEHEVRNRTKGDRIALLLDVRRPDLPWILSLINTSTIKAIGMYCWLQQRRFLVAPPRPRQSIARQLSTEKDSAA